MTLTQSGKRRPRATWLRRRPTRMAPCSVSRSGWRAGRRRAQTWASLPITGAVGNGGLCEIAVSSTATYSANEIVSVYSVGGATGCNDMEGDGYRPDSSYAANTFRRQLYQQQHSNKLVRYQRHRHASITVLFASNFEVANIHWQSIKLFSIRRAVVISLCWAAIIRRFADRKLIQVDNLAQLHTGSDKASRAASVSAIRLSEGHANQRCRRLHQFCPA